MLMNELKQWYLMDISSTQESDCEAGAEVISQGIQWTSFDGIGNGKISGI